MLIVNDSACRLAGWQDRGGYGKASPSPFGPSNERSTCLAVISFVFRLSYMAPADNRFSIRITWQSRELRFDEGNPDFRGTG